MIFKNKFYTDGFSHFYFLVTIQCLSSLSQFWCQRKVTWVNQDNRFYLRGKQFKPTCPYAEVAWVSKICSHVRVVVLQHIFYWSRSIKVAVPKNYWKVKRLHEYWVVSDLVYFFKYRQTDKNMKLLTNFGIWSKTKMEKKTINIYKITNFK